MSNNRLLTDEEMEAAVAKGIEAWASAFRKFDEDAILYPESEEHYVRRAIEEAQEGKTLRAVGERLASRVKSNGGWNEEGDAQIYIGYCEVESLKRGEWPE